PRLEKLAAELGVRFAGSPTAPGAEAVAVKPTRVGLWDRYGGSMPSGWTRWLLEQFEFPFQVVYPPELDKGGLRDKFDVLLLVDGAISGEGGGRKGPADGGDAAPGGDPNVVDELGLPAEFRGRRGSITTARTVPHIKKFLEEGGTVITIGSSTALAKTLGLPVENHLVAKNADGKDTPLSREKYYVPTSVLRASVDPTHPLAWGMDKEVDVTFGASPTFKRNAGVTPVAWYAGKTPLRSGWAWGQEYLDGGVAIADAAVGKGHLVLCGPQVLFRAQPHGTFKFVFNAIARAAEK
ncbi:MAG TPA: peptidase, partial [Gemmataceae bacterium]|nr:peptidase [Gemmataceae bacterium]